MPTWPTGSIPTTNLDAGTDSPASARADLKTTVDQVNAIRDARAVADGVASLDSSTKIPLAQIPAFLGINTVLSWADAGTHPWTIPADVTKVLAFCTGAGGGGGYSANDGLEANGSHGGGGGAGGTAIKFYAVTPGESVSIVVGASGAGASSAGAVDVDGSAGGDSSISIGTPARVITGSGGGGGKGGGTAYGAAPGGATGGDVNLVGGSGVTGNRKGGDGGASFWQGGSVATSTPSAAYGGGGGQGSGSPGGDGKTGSRGLCIIMY